MSEEFDRPTRSGRPTARPPSLPDEDAEIIDLDGDARALLGKVMASQAKLVKSQKNIVESYGRMESGWNTRRQEHETTMREVTGLGKCVRDMREDLHDLMMASKKTSKRVSHTTLAVPGIISCIEVLRAILHHYGIG